MYYFGWIIIVITAVFWEKEFKIIVCRITDISIKHFLLVFAEIFGAYLIYLDKLLSAFSLTSLSAIESLEIFIFLLVVSLIITPCVTMIIVYRINQEDDKKKNNTTTSTTKGLA